MYEFMRPQQYEEKVRGGGSTRSPSVGLERPRCASAQAGRERRVSVVEVYNVNGSSLIITTGPGGGAGLEGFDEA
jgi:hypothetical protein